MSTLALQLSIFGSPADVVELTEIEPDDPGPGQLAVAIEAAPINPSDRMLIKGIYGVRPELPAAPGAEGVGRVFQRSAFRWVVGATLRAQPRCSGLRRSPGLRAMRGRPPARRSAARRANGPRVRQRRAAL